MNKIPPVLNNPRGFSLVELLIVAALVGIVMAGVLGLVQTTQRHVYTSEEVVDVQQNLRVAVDFMSRDLRVGGFGVAGESFITDAPALLSCSDSNDDGDCLDAGESQVLTFQTLTAAGQIARIGGGSGFSTVSDPGSDQKITLISHDLVRLFKEEDYASAPPVYVRIFRPSSRSQPLDRVFQVTDDSLPDDPNDPPSAEAWLKVKGFTAAIVLRPGDVVLRVFDPNLDGDGNPNTNPPQHPNTVTYRLVKGDSRDASQFYLARVPTGVDPGDEDTFEILAAKIVGVQFRYLLANGAEVAPASANDLDKIRAIRITLVGATDAQKTGNANFLTPGQASNVKTRSLTTVVELRNR